MNKFFVLAVSDPDWARIISLSHQFDFYHTQSYSQLERNNEPVLCVAYQDDDFIALPLIIRKIEGTDLYDCTSVYGYCGPVSNLPLETLTQEHVLFFQSELLKFFKEKELVSVFSRLHPFFNQYPVLKNLGIIKEINKTVAIDLTLPKEEQYLAYCSWHKNDIARLHRQGFIVTEASNDSDIDTFIQMYNELMGRLIADNLYYFSREYFYSFLNNPCFKAKLFLVKKDNETAGGALLTFTNNIIQVHLSCDNIKYRTKSPVKMIIDHARLLGCDLNMKLLHMGGGRHGSSDDSLFHWKAGFSNLRFVFSGWQLIVDESKYNYLINFFNIGDKNTSNYFPAYMKK
jgi:hypothetical protein